MRVAALVLAAGRSRRFGTDNKLLAPLEGTAILARTAAAVTTAGFDETVVVTGLDHDAIAEVLRDVPVRLVRCADERDGMGYSIAAGVAALREGTDGVAIVPGDMPLLTSATLRMLADVFAAHGGQRIVHAADRSGAQRNPVIWPGAFFGALQARQGDRGAKALIADAVAVGVAENCEIIDIDDGDAFALAEQMLIVKPAQF
jgi:molybdenum cofactor cytidylyltransferase